MVFEQKYAEMRQAMVETIRRYGVRDSRVLDALASVPRHLFVPKELRNSAYADHPLPIGYGQTISQPYIVAFMTELLELGGEERVLEIGTGSGYQAAVLSLLCKEVYSIEYIPQLCEEARRRLEELGYRNVHIRCGDGYSGWPDAAPFDCVIITCGAPRLPEPLVEQTKTGGRIVVPLGTPPDELTLCRLTKMGKGLRGESFGGVLFVPMRGRVEHPPHKKES